MKSMIFASGIMWLMFAQQVASVAETPDAVSRSPEQVVLTAYKRMEEADRKGDGQLWFALRDRKTLEAMPAALKAAIAKGGRSRPKVPDEALAIRTKSNRAMVLGKATDPDAGTVQYQTVLFVVEDDGWKVSREQWGDKAFDPFVLYASLPPEEGAFLRAGAPWK